MQRLETYLQIILIHAALHKHSNIISVFFGGIRYCSNFFPKLALFSMLKQSNKKKKSQHFS